MSQILQQYLSSDKSADSTQTYYQLKKDTKRVAQTQKSSEEKADLLLPVFREPTKYRKFKL
jgi:uncharacterized protein (DUF2225 family)